MPVTRAPTRRPLRQPVHSNPSPATPQAPTPAPSASVPQATPDAPDIESYLPIKFEECWAIKRMHEEAAMNQDYAYIDDAALADKWKMEKDVWHLRITTLLTQLSTLDVVTHKNFIEPLSELLEALKLKIDSSTSSNRVACRSKINDVRKFFHDYRHEDMTTHMQERYQKWMQFIKEDKLHEMDVNINYPPELIAMMSTDMFHHYHKDKESRLETTIRYLLSRWRQCDNPRHYVKLLLVFGIRKVLPLLNTSADFYAIMMNYIPDEEYAILIQDEKFSGLIYRS